MTTTPCRVACLPLLNASHECTECGAHIAEPHASGCPAGQD